MKNLNLEAINRVADAVPNMTDILTQEIYSASMFSARASELVRAWNRPDITPAKLQQYLDAERAALLDTIRFGLILAAYNNTLDEVVSSINKRVEKSVRRMEEREQQHGDVKP